MSGRFLRLAERQRAAIQLLVDGEPIDALAGDTLMTAILCARTRLRDSEFGDGARAGFCLMGACQDCWVWGERGERLRACSTPAENGMKICTRIPEHLWPPRV